MADFIIKPASGDTLKLQDEGGDDAISISTTGVSTIANATITARTFPTGHILKIVTGQSGAVTTSWTSGSSGTFYDSGVTATLSPASTSNKILVLAQATMGHDLNGEGMWRIQRSIASGSWGNPSIIGDASGSCSRTHSGSWFDSGGTSHLITSHTSFLDSPASTGTCAYRIEMMRWDGTVWMNRTNTTTTAERATGITSITLMEVQQ